MPKGVYERKRRTKMQIITHSFLKELFDYRDGELYWNVSQGTAKSGDLAGSVDNKGYRQIRINGKRHSTHRLIFLYHHGYLPQYLDHIDGDKSNNSIDNLREATNQENTWNRRKVKSVYGIPTSSVYKGVSWNKHAKKWCARIQINGKRNHIGYFTSETEAARAYDDAANELFGEFAKPNIEIVVK